jgi:magnesium transporter
MSDIILDLMNENPINPTALHDLVITLNAVDIADAFDHLSTEKAIQLFRLLPKTMSAEVFAYIDPDKQQVIVEALTDTEIGKVINGLYMDDAVDFIEEMPANVVKRVLRSINEDKRRLINQLLQYPEDSAGSIMTTEYVDLREDITVNQAFDRIRRTGINKETIYTCYVIKRDKLLTGKITAKTLMLAKPDDIIGDIMDTNLIFAHTTDDQETLAATFAKYGLISMAVVDKEQRLVGIVTVDDIVQVIKEEATEDIEKMAALYPSEETYLKTSVFGHTRNRVVWLMILMLSATVTASILSGFEESLAALPMLVFFMPMLMGTGGNAGSQAAVLVIRGMALGEIQIRNIFRVLWTEIRVALLCGVLLGSVNFVRIYFMHGKDLKVCITVTLALIATIVIAKSAGCLLPLAAKSIRIDPAVLSAPLIATIVDATSLFIYFTLASLILSI